MYQIQAQIVTETPHGTLSRQVPTFYLAPNVQGIVSEDHAARIARDIAKLNKPKAPPP